jgi:hypothetical protein
LDKLDKLDKLGKLDKLDKLGKLDKVVNRLSAQNKAFNFFGNIRKFIIRAV